LRQQKESQFDQARETYKDLFRIDVITSESYSSPTIRTLRYLAHRNRGLMFLEELKSKVEALSPSDMYHLLDESVNDLLEALQHIDADHIVENLLLSIFKMFEKERLSRFIVEYELTKEENEDLIPHSRRRIQALEIQPYLKEENKILSKLGLQASEINAPDLNLPDLKFLSPVLDYIKLQQQENALECRKCIKLSEVSVKEMVSALALPLSKPKAKYQRFKDAYGLRDDIILDLKFEIPHDDENNEPNDLMDIEVNTEEAEVSEVKEEDRQGETKRQNQDDAPQRSSKRTRIQDEGTSDSVEHGRYFMGNVGSLIGSELQYQANDKYSLATNDFVNCLNNWTHKYSDYLLQDSSKINADVAIVQIINSNTVDNVDSNSTPDHSRADAEIKWFIENVNSSNYSYNEVRASFVKLILSDSSDGYSLIVNYPLEKDTYALVESFVIAVEDELTQSIPLISIVEVLLEYWLRLKHQSKVRGLSSKLLQDFQSSLNHIDCLIMKWFKVFEEINISSDTIDIRLQWCKLLYAQHQDDFDLESLHDGLSMLCEKCEKLLGSEVIVFSNYDFIPSLSTKDIKAQKDKLDLITTFERTLNCEEEDAEKTIELLERLLLDKPSSTGADIPSSMKSFINNSAISLQLRLWKNLMDSYMNNGDVDSYLNALSMLLSLLLDNISGESYSSQSESQRSHLLLMVLGYYGTHIECFVGNLIEDNWHFEEADESLLTNILRVFEIIYPFCLQENLRADAKSKFVKKLRNICTDTLIAMISLNNKRKMAESADLCLDLLSVVHEEIGRLQFCDASSGRFLKLSQRMLRDSDQGKFEFDILQHLNCRFHISISAERFTPTDHHTEKVELDKESAKDFSSYLLGVFSRKKDILGTIPKPDLKSALDSFYEAVGDPDAENPVIVRNQAHLDQFFSQQLDMRILREAFRGTLSMKLSKPRNDEQLIIDRGLYYFEGASSLNMYKSRKKLAQGKISDLENVVKLLKSDVLSGSERVETWILLGEAFSLQMEDDLTWTSDKLNTPEKRASVANTQKMSLLSYSMALSLLLVNSSPDKQVGALLCGLFSRELYHALQKPLEGLAFLGPLEKTVLTSDGIRGKAITMGQGMRELLLKLVLSLLKMSIGFDDSPWWNYFYLAKVLHKLSQSPIKVLNASIKACNLNPTGIEPFYQLCSFAYKYVKCGKLEKGKATEKLKQTGNLFAELSSEEGINDGFCGIIISCLRKLVAMDKKKWHHRPKYRVATIFADLGEFRKAADEMEGFVLLRSMNKSLINIWKPDLEAPGKHFVYTFQYCNFYLDVIYRLLDLQSLSLFIKKLRRFGPSMVDLPGTWDKACTFICLLIKKIIRSEPSFTDTIVPKLVFSEFLVRSEKLTDYLKIAELAECDIHILVLLYEITEVRRLNNGFGATSSIDDTLISVYLKLYLEKMSTEPTLEVTPSENKENPVKSRVARRDIINASTTMLKVLDSKLKDHRISDEVGFPVREYILNGSDEVQLNAIPCTPEKAPEVEIFSTPRDAIEIEKFATPKETPGIVDLSTPTKDTELPKTPQNTETPGNGNSEYHTPALEPTQNL
jgi:hypothetical protein